MSNRRRRCHRDQEAERCCQADEAQAIPVRLGFKRLAGTFLLLGCATAACLLVSGCPRHPPTKPPPMLPPVPTSIPASLRWEKGVWWKHEPGKLPSVIITNAGSRTISLGGAVASMPRFLSVRDLSLAAPMSEPLTLLLVRTGADHPLRVQGACSILDNAAIRVDNAALVVDGPFRVGGTLDLARGHVAAKSDLLVGGRSRVPALVRVTGGTLTVTNPRRRGRFIIGQADRISKGSFCLDGGRVEADVMQVMPGSAFAFHSGTMVVLSMLVTNGPCVIGDGIHPATLELTGGVTNRYSQGLVITNNATLIGNGVVCGTVANYGTILAGSPNDHLTFTADPGYPLPSVVTNWGRIYMTNGGVLTFQGTVCNNVPAHITAMNKTGPGYQFQFSSIGGLPHILEYKNALSDPKWMFLVSTNGTGEICSLAVTAPTGGARFFRVRIGQ